MAGGRLGQATDRSSGVGLFLELKLRYFDTDTKKREITIFTWVCKRGDNDDVKDVLGYFVGGYHVIEEKRRLKSIDDARKEYPGRTVYFSR